MIRKSTTALTAGAVLALAAAGVLRFAVVPMEDQVPSNFNLTVAYDGTASLLNAQALASGDAAHVFLTNVPVTAAQTVKVTQTSGKTAVMSDDVTVLGPTGTKLLASDHTYAVDRVSLEPATAPSGSKAESHQGLAVGFPLSPAKTNYQFWDPTTQTATPATYTSSSTTSGRATYNYTVHAAGAVTDAATLAALPKSITRTQLAGLAPSLPAAQRTELTAALPTLPANIPLTYTSVTDTKATVDVATGWLLDVSQSQTVTAEMALPTGAAPLAPVLSLTMHATPASVATNVHDAGHAASLLTLAKTTIPYSLLGLAVLLVLLAIWTVRRRRTPPPAVSVEQEDAGSLT